MSQNSAPWLAGLDGTSTWNTKPTTQHTSIFTSLTQDAGSLSQKSDRKARRSLSGNSVHTMKKTRSPLAPIQNNENSSVRRTESPAVHCAPSDDMQGTVQLRSKSSSPAKKTASLEWRKRLLHGKIGYGEQTDLFGPSGLDNIFASSNKPQVTRVEKTLGWMPKTDSTMPSSPPPWPTKALLRQGAEAETSALSTQSRRPSRSEIALHSPASSTRSNPFDLELSEPKIELPQSDDSVVHEQGAHEGRTLGGLTELEQEDFSPVFISKHTTLTGKVDYAAIDSEALKELKRDRTQSQADEEDDDQPIEDESQQQDESVFTDGPESKLQTGIAQDLSLSENLPTGTPEPIGRFVQIQRGGYSVLGSFKHRPLSLEPSAISVIAGVDTDVVLPPAPTPPLTAAGSSTTAAMSKHEAPSTPLKLFAAHDTFTSNRMLHRMCEVDGEVVHVTQHTSKAASQGRRQVSFGDGKLNDAQFEAAMDVASPMGSSPASDVPVPGSKVPLTFREDSAKQSPQPLLQRSKMSREVSSMSKTQSENKRPPASPLKNSTPKRRRTLHATELADFDRSSARQASHVLQEHLRDEAGIVKNERPVPTQLDGPEQQSEHGPIDATLREATDNFLDHEDPSIVDDILEQIEESLTDSNPATIRERAEVVAGEVAKFTIRMSKADNRDSGAMRKPSVTTQDFFREAECVMEYIRSRAAKKKSLLSSVEELEDLEEVDGTDPSPLLPKGSARIESHMRISREPSWEDRPRSGWREPEQQRVHRTAVSMNRVASQLRRWREPDAIEEQDVFIVGSGSIHADFQDEKQHSSEIVYDQHANIRITGPSSEYKFRQDATDSRPQSQRSAQSSNESTRRTENVGTLAPSAVAHLIGSEVGGMTFDKDKQQWVRTRKAEPKPDNGYLNVHESHITSEDDPFREISDLMVDEGSERRRISSPARMLDGAGRPGQLLQPASTGLPLNTRPASFHGSRSPERQFSVSDTVLRPMQTTQSSESTSLPARSSNDSAKSTIGHATIASDERISRVIDDAEAAVKAEHEFIAANRVNNGTTTSAPEVDYLSRLQDEQVLEEPMEQLFKQPIPTAPKPCLGEHNNIPVLPHPRVNNDMVEQSEVSFIAPLPGDRMISVSLSVSKPLAPPAGQVVDLASSPLRAMSTMMLSDLADFTVHDDDAERPSETAMAKRFARYAAAEVNDRFALATKELTRALTDLHPDEPYWEELRGLDLSKQSLSSLHGLDSCCNGLRALNVSTNKLTHLDGVPASVRRLSARANKLSSLTRFSNLPNLQHLDVSQNSLDDLAALAGCIHLRELKADDNAIEDLSALSESNLLGLVCRRNSIPKVEFSEGSLSSLVNLDLSSNKIDTINGLHHLTSLETLKLSGNILKDGLPLKDEMPSLRRLVLRNCGLTTLDVTRMPNLEVLDVDDNSLSTIKGLDTLHKLQVLSMRRQRLADNVVVDVFNKPVEAHTVRLSGNVLPQLQIGQAHHSLKHLELAAVGLSELPAGLGLSMSNLRSLNLNSNSIKDIRPLLHMSALQKLYLAGNRLSRLRKNAAVLVHLPLLSSLDLRNNPMTQGFYSGMASSTVTDLVCRTGGEDIDEDAEYEKAQQARYNVHLQQDADEDARHVVRLDEDTKLRRRVYDMLLAHSCKNVRRLDGLGFDKITALKKDHIWDKLLALGVVRRSLQT